MSVYRRQQSSDPFRNYPIGPGIQSVIDAYNERIVGELFEGDGPIDLVCINGVWQEPPK